MPGKKLDIVWKIMIKDREKNCLFGHALLLDVRLWVYCIIFRFMYIIIILRKCFVFSFPLLAWQNKKIINKLKSKQQPSIDDVADNVYIPQYTCTDIWYNIM